MTTQAIETQTTAAKFAAMRDFQERERGLVGRRSEMHTTQVAIAAQLHLLLFGSPGVAKSMTVDGILAHLPDLSKFKTQAYKASPPEQFLGPISIKGMERDEFVRIIARRMADVEVAFVDELTRAPRAVLPAFQGMMVEREFDSGNGVEPVPLMSLIGTCNHIPDDPELEAFLDRFALKLIVKPPASQSQFVDILKGALRRRDAGEPAVPDELLVSRDELVAFQRHVATIHVPDDVLEKFGEMWSNLLGVGIQPSIRRYVDVTKAMQACAAIDGRDEVSIDDMQIAQHALWTHPDQAEAVYAEVVQFASEWVKERSALLDAFSDTLDRLTQVQTMVAAGADTSEHTAIAGSEKSITDHSLAVVNEYKKLDGLISRHIAAATGQDTSDLEAVRTQMDAGRAWVSDRILGGLVL